MAPAVLRNSSKEEDAKRKGGFMDVLSGARRVVQAATEALGFGNKQAVRNAPGAPPPRHNTDTDFDIGQHHEDEVKDELEQVVDRIKSYGKVLGRLDGPGISDEEILQIEDRADPTVALMKRLQREQKEREAKAAEGKSTRRGSVFEGKSVRGGNANKSVRAGNAFTGASADDDGAAGAPVARGGGYAGRSVRAGSAFYNSSSGGDGADDGKPSAGGRPMAQGYAGRSVHAGNAFYSSNPNLSGSTGGNNDGEQEVKVSTAGSRGYRGSVRAGNAFFSSVPPVTSAPEGDDNRTMTEVVDLRSPGARGRNAEKSVRRGNAFGGEKSVRAGSAFPADAEPSVRVGDAWDTLDHVLLASTNAVASRVSSQPQYGRRSGAVGRQGDSDNSSYSDPLTKYTLANSSAGGGSSSSLAPTSPPMSSLGRRERTSSVLSQESFPEGGSSSFVSAGGKRPPALQSAGSGSGMGDEDLVMLLAGSPTEIRRAPVAGRRGNGGSSYGGGSLTSPTSPLGAATSSPPMSPPLAHSNGSLQGSPQVRR